MLKHVVIHNNSEDIKTSLKCPTCPIGISVVLQKSGLGPENKINLDQSVTLESTAQTSDTFGQKLILP